MGSYAFMKDVPHSMLGVLNDRDKKNVGTLLLKSLSRNVDRHAYLDILFNSINEKIDQIKSDIREVHNYLKIGDKLNQKMKNQNEQYLVELLKYDKEAEKIDMDVREVIYIYSTFEPKTEFSKKLILDMLKAKYVNHKDEIDVKKSLLTIKGEVYSLTGHGIFQIVTEDNWNAYTNNNTKDPLVDINIEDVIEATLSVKYANGTEDIKRICKLKDDSLQNIVNYYNSKYHTGEKVYSIPVTKEKPGPKRKESKKEYYDRLYKERMKKKDDVPWNDRPWKERYKDLPKIGESEPKPIGKVCCLEKQTGKIFRGPKNNVKKLVDTNAYEYCQKKYWKQCEWKWNEKNQKIFIKGPAVKNEETGEYELPITTNITKSVTGKPLGERAHKKQLNQDKRNSVAMMNKGGNRFKIDTIEVPSKERSKKGGSSRHLMTVEEVEVPMMRNGIDGPEQMYDKKGNPRIKIVKKFVRDKDDKKPLNYSYNRTITPKSKKINQLHNFKKGIPDPVQQNERMAKDLKEYEEKLKHRTRKSRNQKRGLDCKAWEAILLDESRLNKGDLTKIVRTIWIKAFTEKEANDKLQKEINCITDKLGLYLSYKTGLIKLAGKLTGNRKPWVKKTGKNRIKNKKIDQN
jgi:hypothetical protein